MRARAIASEVGSAIARWRTVAGEAGLTKTEIDRMAAAFEDDDLRMAVSG